MSTKFNGSRWITDTKSDILKSEFENNVEQILSNHSKGITIGKPNITFIDGSRWETKEESKDYYVGTDDLSFEIENEGTSVNPVLDYYAKSTKPSVENSSKEKPKISKESLTKCFDRIAKITKKNNGK